MSTYAVAISKQKEAEAVPREQWLTHDELHEALELLYPGTQRGRDYWAAMMVIPDSPEPASTAFIAKWAVAGVPEPTLADLMKAVQPHVSAAKEKSLASNLRKQRDALLDQSDVLVLRAMESENTARIGATKAYRQSLRDLPQQTGFPRNCVWPVLPKEPKT